MEQNDENTIGARLEKILMDAADAADETITAAVDEKDPVRRMTVLVEGYRKAVKALLPDEDLERLHLAEKCGMDFGRGPSETVLVQIVPVAIPGGVDGTMPGPDPAEETVEKRTLTRLLKERFGLELHRFAAGRLVKIVGARRTPDCCEDQLWEIEVDREDHVADVRCCGETLFRVECFRSLHLVEKIAISGLVRALNERRKRNQKRARARIRNRAAKEAARD